MDPRSDNATWQGGAGEAICEDASKHTPRPERLARVPAKWRRVLGAFLTGRSFNRFDAERQLSDHCLHSTVSTIEGKGVRISRRTEKVPGYLGIATDVCRYWLDEADNENIARARALLSKGAV